MSPAQSRKIRVAQVVFDARTAGAEAVYSYQAGPELQRGAAVCVPLGRRQALGFVFEVRDVEPESLDVSLDRLKSIDQTVIGLDLPDPVVDLVELTASEYLCPLSVALGPAVPAGILDRVSSTWIAAEGDPPPDLTALQREVLLALRAAGSPWSPPKAQAAVTTKTLRTLAAKGLVRERLAFVEPRVQKSGDRLYRLTPESSRLEAFVSAHAKKKPAQALTIMRLQETEGAGLTLRDIKGLCGVTEATLKALIDEKLLVTVDEAQFAPLPPPDANLYQRLAIEAIADAVQSHMARRFLLFGVTGSGKTEVYLRAAAEALRAGRQVLYLVPEIALASQAVQSLRDRFGSAVAILHSSLSPAERIANWRAIRNGEAPIVLGARSALFAPLENLGLIVVDEEHEASYKQESAPRYHARRLAEFLAERHGCPLVLGSATPSIETFYDAEQERLTLLSLPERAAASQLPEVHIVDLGEGYRRGAPALFTEELREALAQTFAAGQQSILFLNRRAYAPSLICRDCGASFACPNCAVALTFSRKLQRLRCHHCGHAERVPDQCPTCGGHRLQPFGIGTEKVEEAVAQLLPEARVARLDRDVALRKGALEETLAAFGSRHIDILVGTQMVAKGLNFPGVTLVGVVAADLSLSIPDFRATERTYQLLSQVAGRAGRGRDPGRVVIQTFSPDHIAVQAAREHRFLALYEPVLEERVDALYPPVRRLVNIVFSSEDRSAAAGHAAATAERLRLLALDDLGVLGPAECAIERLNNQWRFHVLVKMPPETPPHALSGALERPSERAVSMVVDVDPYSML